MPIVYIEPAEEGGYIASVPALPGCVTQGETSEEALTMAEDAIRGYIESLKKHGEPLPFLAGLIGCCLAGKLAGKRAAYSLLKLE